MFFVLFNEEIEEIEGRKPNFCEFYAKTLPIFCKDNENPATGKLYYVIWLNFGFL